MEKTIKLTKSKQKIADRRLAVKTAYNKAVEKKEAVTLTVDMLSKKFSVSTVTIYADIDLIKKEDKKNV